MTTENKRDPLTADEREHLDGMYFAPVSRTLAIIDRLCARIEKLAAVAEAADSLALIVTNQRPSDTAVVYEGASVLRLQVAIAALKEDAK